MTEARTFHQTDRRAGFDVNGKRAGSAAAAALKFLMLRSVLFLSFQAMTVAAKKRSEERSANQPANPLGPIKNGFYSLVKEKTMTGAINEAHLDLVRSLSPSE